jgi:CRP/FNR family transcriptional regulator, cyclic AMP receptor protein
MAVQINNEVLRRISLLRGLDEAELSLIANISELKSYAIGEICQTDGISENRVHLIYEGRAGVIVRVPNISYASNEIIPDTLGPGDVFGWSTLIKGVPWSTLRVLEPLKVVFVNTEDLLNLCENNNHLGYIIMKNLASLIASKFRRNRMSVLNTLVAMKGA